MGGSIGLTALIGGILLAIVILYAVIVNNRRSRSGEQRTEQATKDLYARVDAQDKASDPDNGAS